ncbi:MAG TPA: hypothetical protein VFM54_13440 [Micromonosporaceae bacterium]|nr:hypothetical protein [Micromonosporaceae bacterium]
MSVDVSGYGAHDDVRQQEIQRTLLDILDVAGARAGLARQRWKRQAKGDEELSLVPPDEPHQRVAGEFCLELEAVLHGHNLGRDRSDRLRLRLAIDEGPADDAANGYVGRAVVGASRLCSSQVARQALNACPDANLVVIVSHGVFRDHVDSGRGALRRDHFRRVAVKEKEVDEYAWVWVPGAAEQPDLAPDPASRTSPPDTPGAPASGVSGHGQQVHNRFVSPVTIHGGDPVFGIRNG